VADLAHVEGWVELELLGHRIHHGRLSIRHLTPEQGSPVVLQLDRPAVGDAPAEVHYYTPQAVYGIHPTTEEAVIEKLTPWVYCREPINSPDTLAGELCSLRKGHDGDHEGLPF
jgi:hypothetical protein